MARQVFLLYDKAEYRLLCKRQLLDYKVSKNGVFAAPFFYCNHHMFNSDILAYRDYLHTPTVPEFGLIARLAVAVPLGVAC